MNTWINHGYLHISVCQPGRNWLCGRDVMEIYREPVV